MLSSESNRNETDPRGAERARRGSKYMSESKVEVRVGMAGRTLYSATSSTKLTSLTWDPARSSRTGIRSRSSLS